MPVVTTVSPAKLNLYLELLGRRPDGFHELETVMVAVDRCDHVRVTTQDDSAVRVVARWLPGRAVWQQRLGGCAADMLQIPQDASNLVVRAAERMREVYGLSGGWQIRLDKSIPAGAGMGGASSNAASVLRCVARLHDIPLDDRRLWEIGGELGSDVPFFLGLPGAPSRAALATGRGERLQPVALDAAPVFVVAFPPQSLSTAAVYAACQVPATPRTSRALTRAMAAGDTAAMAAGSFNRLAEPARRLSPWIDRLLGAMRRADLNGCQLTGSGSACFAAARSRRHALRSVRHLAAEGFEVSFIVSPLSLPTPLQ
ncbi:4-(cytidine 5'-diphospho)-2-C-methyl-D-erythritol kinase [Roseimaritima sediminicola]|uniref:4-(cytidine 5'-diphospho)-2-C-methyl-D-erythritol kinase n=1 Tax=Roseimaritima sediminicola TaxID=2662066 RepID=UPI001387309F|nr:4-(cytidine 5'-diphospho)-2-C-methyl-D-erythritol kinase [Roseimaritima sediminicola]